jgi:quercetin dioxygenase-like cupin family protein
MTKTLTLATAMLLGAVTARADAPAKIPSMDDQVTVQLADAKWAAPKIEGYPAGVLASLIAGDPTTGASIAYAKIPGGTHFPLHWHSSTEYTVLIAGKAVYTVEGKSVDVVPGAYLVIPPKAKHKVDCAAGADCVLLVRRSGKIDFNWVK